MLNPNPLLARFGAAFRLELRLIVLHWSYGLLHLLWTLLLFSTIAQRDSGTAQMTFESGLLFVVRTLISGVALFLVTNTFTRTTRLRFTAIDDTLPTGLEVSLGRWLACLVAVLAFILEPMLLGAIRGPFVSFVIGIVPFTLKLAVLLGFSTTLAWLLVSLLGARRWLFLAMAGVWVGLIIIPALFQTSPIPFVSLFNLTGNGSPLNYTEVFGTLPQGAQPFWFHLFYAALLGIFLMGVLARLQRQRQYRISARVLASGVATLLIALLAMGGYSTGVLNAQAQEDYARAIYERHIPDFVVDSQQIPEEITRYDLTVDLTDLGQPRFSAEFDLINRGTTPLVAPRLTLHHDLILTASSERYTREGDLVTLAPSQPLEPRQMLTVKFQYSGTLWLVDLIGGSPSAHTFTNADGVRLPYLSCWYPMAGWLIPNELYGPMRVMGAPAQVTLQITGAPGMTFASNLSATGERTFAAQASQWISLVGSPRLVKEVTGNVTLYAAAFDQQALSALIPEHYLPTLRLIQYFIPDVTVNGLIIFGMERAPFPVVNTLIDGWLILPTSRSWAAYLSTWGVTQRTFFISDLLAPFFPSAAESVTVELPGGNGTVTGYGANAGVMEGIAQFIELYARFNGDAKKISDELAIVLFSDEKRLPPGVPMTNPSLTYKTITLQSLSELYTEGGDAALIRTLRQIRGRHAELIALPPEKVGMWLREAAHVP